MSTEERRIRLTNDLERQLLYVANRQKTSLSREEAASISKRVMANSDIENTAFAHKGVSWIAREIIEKRTQV